MTTADHGLTPVNKILLDDQCARQERRQSGAPHRIGRGPRLGDVDEQHADRGLPVLVPDIALVHRHAISNTSDVVFKRR
jgi:hypothetical protein